MRALTMLAVATLVVAGCAIGDEARNDAPEAGSATVATPQEVSSTSHELTTTTGPEPTSTTASEVGRVGWVGQEIELRLPPGGEGIDSGFDPYNMQTTVWVDGQQTGYWARDFVGFVGGSGGVRPSPLAVAVVGEGPDVHRALWEEEANREFPLPTVEPTEPGVINDLLLWAVRHEGVLADGSGARYTILDVQPVRLIETESWAGISEAYYVDWDGEHAAPLVFGWNDWEAYEALAEQSDEPIPARLVFELVHTPVGYRIVVVDPAATHFGWPDPD